MKYLVCKSRPIIHFTILLFCIISIYWQVYSFDFLYKWDDQWFVTNYMTKGGFNFKNLYEAFTTFYYGQYAPLNQYYYMLLYTFFEYQTAYYHLASVLVHFVNCILVYRIIFRLSSDIFGLKNKALPSAFITSLLFSVLPINIEPVAWVAASKVGLYALFYLSALLSYISYITHKKPLHFYLTIFFYILSFGAKEQAVTLPVCMLFFDYFYNRNIMASTIWLEKLPIFILSILFGLISISSQKIDSQDFYPLYQRAPLAAYTITEYATKCLIPVNLSYLYPFPFQKGQPVPAWMWLQFAALPVIVFCLWEFIRQKWVIFALGFFLIHILLVCNILSLARFSVVADRYAYIASIGLCYLLANLFLRAKFFVTHSKLSVSILSVYTLMLMGYSACQLPVWRNADTLKARLKNTIEHRTDYQQRKTDNATEN